MELFAVPLIIAASAATLVLAILALVWARRAPRSTRAVIAQYTPPENVSILLGGIIVGERKRSIAAQLVDLAVRGAIRVLAPLGAGGPYRVELIDMARIPGTVEIQVVRAIFGNAPSPGQVVRINKKSAPLSRRLQTAQGRAASIASTSELSVTTTNSWRQLFLAPQIALFIALLYQGGEAFPVVVVIGLATLFVGLVPVSTLTPAGVELRDHLRGLREYISLAEADRMRMLQAPGTALTKGEIYLLTEKLLGWAVLFGFGKEWARALEIQARELGETGGISADLGTYIVFSDTFDGFAVGESDAALTDSDSSSDFSDSSSGFDFGDASSSGGWGSDGGGDGGDGGGGGGD